jgi:hypothetical protein
MARRAARAEPVDLFQQMLKEYPDEHIFCRDSGHHWKSLTASRNADGTIRRVMVCTTCQSHRNQTLDRDGYILASNYSYEAGYIVPGLGRWTGARRAAARLASVMRQGID